MQEEENSWATVTSQTEKRGAPISPGRGGNNINSTVETRDQTVFLLFP